MSPALVGQRLAGTQGHEIKGVDVAQGHLLAVTSRPSAGNSDVCDELVAADLGGRVRGGWVWGNQRVRE